MKGEKVLGGTIKYAAHVMPLFMEGTTTIVFILYQLRASLVELLNT
jgi:hypothetical protein